MKIVLASGSPRRRELLSLITENFAVCPADAADMLRRLRGRTHEVLTGLAVLSPDGGAQTLCTRTEVTFRDFSEEELEEYLATGEPLDKAGAYGIQGHGALLIEGICGDYYSVMGLPVAPLGVMLRKLNAVR